MKKINFLLCCIFATYSNLINAQSNIVIDAYAKVDASTGSNLRATFFIEVLDTNDISQLEIKLGTIDGQSNLVSHTFDYDVTGGLPVGFSYSRTGNKVILETNDFSDMSTYFGTVRIKNINGLWSDEYKFITN